jgi:hypothetical protein
MARDDLQPADQPAAVEALEGALETEKHHQSNGNGVDHHQLDDAARPLDRGSSSTPPDLISAIEQPGFGKSELNEPKVPDETVEIFETVPPSDLTDCETVSHLERLDDFAKEMSTAAATILSKRAIIDRVVVLISYWEKATGLEHLRKNANELHKFFQDCKFDTTEYQLSQETEQWDLISAIRKAHNKIKKEPNSLFIFYYGGHADKPTGNDTRVWRSDVGKEPSLEWSAVMKPAFENLQCRKLFILDCCFAGAMIDIKPKWQGTCEVLGACSPDDQASAWKSASFTKALCNQLKERAYDICELHSELCGLKARDEDKLRTTPFYRAELVGQARSSVIKPKVNLSSGSHEVEDEATQTLKRFRGSQTRVLISIKFKGTVAGFMEQMEDMKLDWMRWFHHTPDIIAKLAMELVKGTTLHSVFASNSCTTIWTMPLWLWDTMGSIGGCQYLGIVRSRDHLSPGTAVNIKLVLPSDSSQPRLSPGVTGGSLEKSASDVKSLGERALTPPLIWQTKSLSELPDNFRLRMDNQAPDVKSEEKRAGTPMSGLRDDNPKGHDLVPMPRKGSATDKLLLGRRLTRFSPSHVPEPDVLSGRWIPTHSAFSRSDGDPAEEDLKRKINKRKVWSYKSRIQLSDLPRPGEGGKLSVSFAIQAR